MSARPTREVGATVRQEQQQALPLDERARTAAAKDELRVPVYAPGSFNVDFNRKPNRSGAFGKALDKMVELKEPQPAAVVIEKETPESAALQARIAASDAVVAKIFNQPWQTRVSQHNTSEVDAAICTQRAFIAFAQANLIAYTRAPYVQSDPECHSNGLTRAHPSYAPAMQRICAILSNRDIDIPSRWGLLFRYWLRISGRSKDFEEWLQSTAPKSPERKLWRLFDTAKYDAEAAEQLVRFRARKHRLDTGDVSLRTVLRVAFDAETFQMLYRSAKLDRVIFSPMRRFGPSLQGDDSEKGPFYAFAYLPYIAELCKTIRRNNLLQRLSSEETRTWAQAAIKQVLHFAGGHRRQSRGCFSAKYMLDNGFDAAAEWFDLLYEMRMFNNRNKGNSTVKIGARAAISDEVKAAAKAGIVFDDNDADSKQSSASSSASDSDPEKAPSDHDDEDNSGEENDNGANRPRRRVRMTERHGYYMPFQSFLPGAHLTGDPELFRHTLPRDEAAMMNTLDEQAGALIDLGCKRPHPDIVYAVYTRIRDDFLPVLHSHNTKQKLEKLRLRRQQFEKGGAGVDNQAHLFAFREDFMSADFDALANLERGGQLVQLIIDMLTEATVAMRDYLYAEERTEALWNALCTRNIVVAGLVAHFRTRALAANLGACTAQWMHQRGMLLASMRVALQVDAAEADQLLRDNDRAVVQLEEKAEATTAPPASKMMSVTHAIDVVHAKWITQPTDKPSVARANELFTTLFRYVATLSSYYLKVAIHCHIDTLSAKARVRFAYPSDYVNVDAFHAEVLRTIDELIAIVKKVDGTNKPFMFHAKNDWYRYTSTDSTKRGPCIRLAYPLVLDTCKCIQLLAPAKPNGVAMLQQLKALAEDVYRNFSAHTHPWVYEAITKEIYNEGQASLWARLISDVWKETGFDAWRNIQRQYLAMQLPDIEVQAERMTLLYLMSTKAWMLSNRFVVTSMLSDASLGDATERLEELASMAWHACATLSKK